MNYVFMPAIELSPEDFRREYPRFLQENPGAEVRISEEGRLVARLILPSGPRPAGWPAGANLVGKGPSLSDFVIEQRG